MSTKTTFKRIALVTVAALGFGVMSVAPSSAVLNPTFTLSSATTTVALGEAASTTLTSAGFYLTSDTVTTTVALSGWPTTATSSDVVVAFAPTVTAVDTDTAYTGGSNGEVRQTVSGLVATTSIDSFANGLVSARTKISVTPTAVGTYTYTITSEKVSGGTVAAGTASVQTWTVVVTAPELLGSTAFISTTTGSAATVDSTTLSSTTYLATSAAVARIDVAQFQDAAKLVPMNLKAAKAVTVAISGAGAVGESDNNAVRGPSVTTLAGTSTTPATSHTQDYYVFADGRTGKATITITVGTTVYTKSFLFIGKLDSYSVVAAEKNIGVGATGTLTVTGKDAGLNDATLGTVTAVSSDATIATATVSGGTVSVVGVKAGTATITLMNATTAAAATIIRCRREDDTNNHSNWCC
jgi:hypothetical protein